MQSKSRQFGAGLFHVQCVFIHSSPSSSQLLRNWWFSKHHLCFSRILVYLKYCNLKEQMFLCVTSLSLICPVSTQALDSTVSVLLIWTDKKGQISALIYSS